MYSFRYCRSVKRLFGETFHRTIDKSTVVAKGDAENGSSPRGVKVHTVDKTEIAYDATVDSPGIELERTWSLQRQIRVARYSNKKFSSLPSPVAKIGIPSPLIGH